MSAFNTKIASLVTGASERQLRHWDRTGVVKPSVSPAAGRGSRRLYAFLDLIEARAATALRSKGLSLQKLRKVLRVLKEHPDQVRHPLAELTLLTDGDTVFRLTDDWKAMEDILRRGQLVSSLAIKPLYDFVRKRLAKQVKKSRTMVEVVDKKYRVLIRPDFVDGGFIAECPSLPGCVTDGETKEEALRNMRDAIADWHSAGKEKRLAKAE